MSRHRHASTASGGIAAASPSTAQLINERAQILGLQLQQAALATRIAAAIASHGQPTPVQQLQELLRRGVLDADLASAREEVAALKAMLDRVTSGRLASTSAPATSTPPQSGMHRAGSGRHASQAPSSGAVGAAAGGASGASAAAVARAASSKQFSALAAEHVRHWLEQAREAVAVLEDLGSPGGIEEWRPSLEGTEPTLPPRPPGGPPVAHFIARIPPELAALMTLPATAYDQADAAAPGGAGGGGAGADAAGGGVLWSAAPLLPDPAAGVCYRVALHEAAEQLWPALAGGDLVLLLPGRYNWPEGSVVLRAAVRLLGLGRQAGDVVIHNNEEDDVFVECCAGPPPPPPPPPLQQHPHAQQQQQHQGRQSHPSAAGCEGGGVVLENLTLLQLGGYEGALRVLRGRTTLVDVNVQFAMGGLQVDPGAHLVMRGCRVVGGATAGVSVAAGGVLELLAGCEVTRCGGGDDVVPKDLGGVEVMVPFADYPRLAPPSARAVLQAHQDLLSPRAHAASDADTPSGGNTPGSSSNASTGGGPGAPAAAAAVGAGVYAGWGAPPVPPPLESLPGWLGSVQPPATVVLGPGCSIQNTRGFAVSLVKKRALASYHETLHSGGAGQGGSQHAAAGGGASGGGGGGCSLAAALAGARVLVARGAALGPNNSRGAVGVVELEYHQMEGDEVNRRTASRHFHAVQLAARQLQEGFASPGVDWSATRIRLESNPARPGRRATKIEVAAAAAATNTALRGQYGGADGTSASGAGGGRRAGNGVVVGCRTLRQLLCAAVARAQRRQRGLDGGNDCESGSGSRSSSSGSSYEDEDSHTQSCSDSGGSAREDGEDDAESTSSSGADEDALVHRANGAASPARGQGAVGAGCRRSPTSRSGPGPPRVCAACGRATRAGVGGAGAGARSSEPGPAEGAPASDRGLAPSGPASGDACGNEGTEGGSMEGRTDATGDAAAAQSGAGGMPVESAADHTPRGADTALREAQSAGGAAAGTADGTAVNSGSDGADVASSSGAAVVATSGAAHAASGGGAVSGGKLRRCGGCLSVWYCGEECQRRDWPRHAPECRALRGAEAGAGARGAVT